MSDKIGFKDLDLWLKIPIVYFWGNIGILAIALVGIIITEVFF